MVALRAADGMPRWSTELHDAILAPSAQPLAVSGSAVYIASATDLTALRAADGAPIGQVPVTRYSEHTNAFLSITTAADGSALYLWGLQSRQLTTVQAADGAQLWQLTAGSSLDGQAGVVLVDGILYVQRNTYHAPTNGDSGVSTILFAVRASDGSLLWSHQLAGETLGIPAAADGVLYVGSIGALSALRASDGMTLWRSEVGTHHSLARILVAHGVIFAISLYSDNGGRSILGPEPFGPTEDTSTYVKAFAASDGAQYWSTQAGGTGELASDAL